MTLSNIGQMDVALGTFLTPEQPISDHVHQAHWGSVFNLARRYFFLLFRCSYIVTNNTHHLVLYSSDWESFVSTNTGMVGWKNVLSLVNN